MSEQKDFDGHLEYNLAGKTPDEKLDYLAALIQWKAELKQRVQRDNPGGADTGGARCQGS